VAGSVTLVAPQGVDDPRRPSGGNTYDRRLHQELAAAGWTVRLREVAGDWPWAGAESRHHLAAVLAAVPDGDAVLLDGLVALAAPAEVVAAGHRLRTLVLVHMPLGRDDEGAVLRSAAGVVTTSDWTRRLLLTRHALDPARVHAAAPGVDPAPVAPGTPHGGALLCVGAVVPAKGHDLLVTALAGLTDRSWRCLCAGSLDRDPAYVATLRDRVRALGLATRVTLAGSLSGPGLQAAYAGADALVHPSRAETYGMVVTEALAHGLPVLATAVGGVPEALGRTGSGERPGVLTAPDDADALAGSLRAWLADEALRRRLRAAAVRRRDGLTRWSLTGALVARVLEEVAA